MGTRRILAHGTAAAITPVVAYYIRMQRRVREPWAVPLDAGTRGRLEPYFAARDLDAVRLFVTDEAVVPELPLSGLVRRLGFEYPSVSLLAGITLEHLVAVRPPLWDGLLFHELVHVVQFRVLGLRRFCHLYARGLLETGAYETIPLERCAYELEARFDASPLPFVVEEEVQAWLEQGRF